MLSRGDRTRFALTNWWMQPNQRPGAPTDLSVCVRSAHKSGPRRYAAVPPNLAREVVRGLAELRPYS